MCRRPGSQEAQRFEAVPARSLFRSSPACLAMLGLAALLASACAPLATAPLPRREIGATSVSGAREDLSRGSEQETADRWLSFAAGAAEDHRALSGACERGYSLPELVAFLRFTARDDQLLSEALAEFWTNHHCRRQSQRDADPSAVYRRGWSEAWESAGRVLLAIRQSDDILLLQSLVREAGGSQADPIAQAKGLVARARLEEMARRGLQPPPQSSPLPPAR